MKELQEKSVWHGVAWLALFVAVAVLVYRAVLPSGALLSSVDDNVGLISMNKRMVEVSAFHRWGDGMLMGLPEMSGIRPSFLLLKVLSAEAFTNVFHGLCLSLGAWLVALWLRGKGLKAPACVFGALVAFWTGTNLTLTYAGHIGKYGVMCFCALALWATGKWGRSGRPAWGAVAGAAAGAMFLEQGDVALFCAVLLMPVGLLEAWRAVKVWKDGATRSSGPKVLPWVIQLAPAGVAAMLLAGGAALATRGSGVTDGVAEQSPAEKWEFITQWSQPPDESVDFIAPGWAGWRTGDPEGPYWGKTGRGIGLLNLRYETVYVGALPLFFALLAAVDAVRRRRGEVLLWTALTLLALVLSFGKYTPLYRLVAALPGFSDIRNPNKFIHFFQLGWGVLAAVGLDAAMRMEARRLVRWSWVAWGLAAVAALAAGNAWSAPAAGWGDAGKIIQHNKTFALWWCAGSFAMAGAIVRLLAAEDFPMIGKKISNDWKTGLPWLAGALVLCEAAWLLGPHYIQAMPRGFVARNALTEHLQAERNGGRVAMARQDTPWNNLWLTFLFPHEGIPSVNVTQLPRPPADFSAWKQAVRNPVRQWQLAAVSHILVQGPLAKQILESPDLGWKMRLDWAYSPVPDPDGAWGVEAIPPERAMGRLDAVPETVLVFRNPVARVQPVAYWWESEDAEALRVLGTPDFVPGEQVLLEPGAAERAGLGSARAESSARGRVSVEEMEERPGAYRIVADVKEAPGILRIAENWNPGWKCRIDGKSAPVLRADYLFQAVALTEPGRHVIELRYAPSSGAVWLEAAGLLLGLGAAAWLAVGALLWRKDD